MSRSVCMTVGLPGYGTLRLRGTVEDIASPNMAVRMGALLSLLNALAGLDSDVPWPTRASITIVSGAEAFQNLTPP